QIELSSAKLTAAPEGVRAREFTDALAARLVPNLVLEANGVRLPLSLSSSAIEFVPGVAALPTMRLRLELKADRSTSAEATLGFNDRNVEGRVGWKEVIAVAGGGAALRKSSVPSSDRTRALTEYPTDPAEPPSEVTSAELTVRWDTRSSSK